MFTGQMIPPISRDDHQETMLVRVWTPAAIAALVIAGVPARLLMEVWAPLGYLFWPAAVIMFVLVSRRLVTLGWHTTPARCPSCRRLIRNRQQRCHKCGQPVT